MHDCSEHTQKIDGEVLMNQVKTVMNRSKLVGKKRRNLQVQTKKILKKVRKVQKMAAKVAAMRAETTSLRTEMNKMNDAAEEKKEVVMKLEKELDHRLIENLLLSATEQVLVEVLFPPSGDY